MSTSSTYTWRREEENKWYWYHLNRLQNITTERTWALPLFHTSLLTTLNEEKKPQRPRQIWQRLLQLVQGRDNRSLPQPDLSAAQGLFGSLAAPAGVTEELIWTPLTRKRRCDQGLDPSQVWTDARSSKCKGGCIPLMLPSPCVRLLVRLQPSNIWNNKLPGLRTAGEEADLCCSCQLQEKV